MYGFSGYGTNAYGSERQGFAAPLIKLAMRIVRNGYNARISTALAFRNLTLANPQTAGNAVIALMLRFRNLVLSNPETNQQTIEL